MRRVRWQNGEVIAAEHFVELERWTLRQVSGGRLGTVGMGLVWQGGRSAGDGLVQPDSDARRARLGPLRALTSSGSLLELEEAVDIELDRDRIGSEWSILFLLVDERTDDRGEVSDGAELVDGPEIALPALRLSTRVSPGIDHVPVARVRLQGRNVIVDESYLPPCVICDAHPLLAQELAGWRKLVEQVADQSLASAFRWQGLPELGAAAQAATFYWMASATAAAGLSKRVMGTECLFRTAARFGADILNVLGQFQPARAEHGDLRSIVERLAGFDTMGAHDLAATLKSSRTLRAKLRRLAQVEGPESPAIELSGLPTTTPDTKPDRWKVVLPLTKPMRESVASGSKVRVALKLKSGKDFRVRVHPSKSWAAISQASNVPMRHDVEAQGLDERFNAYFIYGPADDELQESRIVFHLLVEPLISDRDSVAIEVLP
ncbi:hypothetical protein J2W42_001130 [Rhizobium tibeticum]|uniref:type VI secretion system baseplate subunit TssK n=1 Tax=Rhizobium tibeticum TaxID=501024 RepID=UPI0027808D76|nr:type VI secretion system baseplate subunit TssK [Rhizobium tibeticum]MDP9808292.1 hypothetical protein [Rhizobium tibeticum]